MNQSVRIVEGNRSLLLTLTSRHSSAACLISNLWSSTRNFPVSNFLASSLYLWSPIQELSNF